jgi:hypothetical protein
VPSRSRLVVPAIAAVLLFAAPSTAGAAIVNNGDFETGNFSGWQLSDTPDGDWIVYTGSSVDIFTVPAPPQGTHAAITFQENVSRQIMYQDVTLPPAGGQIRLSLFAYYVADENAPIVSPDSLDILSMENEQYRIDVMRPSAALDSVASGDILATVFRTQTGAPMFLSPTLQTADLSAFAGQTVRLRFAVTATEDELNAGTDAVAINGLTVGDAIRNNKKGTAQVPVTVTDAGTLALTGDGVKPSSASKSVAVQPGTTNLLVKAKGKKKKKLNRKGKAKVQVTISYTPNLGSPLSEQDEVKLKKKR